MRSWVVMSACVLGTVLGSGCAAPKPVSTRSLLAEMTDLARLAEYPDPPYTCKQFSSYDPASTTPDDPKTWFANADVGQYLRVEERDGRKENVMMDADGPGAIVRLWSANPKGTLRIYLDGRPEPALEVPMADLLGGKLAGIPTPIACERGTGWNSYFPIPYAKHCKVTNDQGGFYYHVNYRTYPPGTQVETFQAAQLESLASESYPVAGRLTFPRSGGAAAPGRGKTLERTFDVAPNSVSSADFSGPAAITNLELRVEAQDVVAALRQVLLTLTFDGEPTVEVPLGDFFGAAPGINVYTSLALGVTPAGEMWSHWVMPFEKSARLAFRNLGQQPAKVHVTVETARYRWTPRSLHFAAQWKTAFDVPTRPMQDWNYATIKGRGVFTGAAFAIANPVKQWWGEGDEKIYVDGEKFPSFFGTGTEDYYAYAWGCATPFMHAYHSQPRCDGPGNYGHTAVNRWHLMDCIPFNKDFRFDMELWHWWEGRVPEMSVVTYWYARPGATSNRAALQPSDLRLVLLPAYVPPRVKGALEGEELRIIQKTGEVGPQPIEACSNEQQLWWRGGQPGNKLVLGFPAPAAGRYRVFVRCLKAPDYGIHQLSVNDEKPGEPLDFYNKGVVAADEAALGTFELTAGENRLTAEIVGANDQAVKSYMFGLDYIRLEPAR